jgi:site-specific DNA-methyltransferase (adenine-specific)
MKPILASDIVVPENRQRQEFDQAKLAELSASIQKHGLLHPIVLRPLDGKWYIVAGERRLRAMQMLIELDIPIKCGEALYAGGTVPYTALGDLGPLEAEEAELEENIRRVDLTWQERANATARLHALRTHQAGAKAGVQTLAATAAEIVGAAPTSNDVAKVKTDIVLAQHLNDPEVAKATSEKEALKVIERKAKAAHRAKLAEQFDLSSTPHTLIHDNCLERLAHFPDASFDCLLTDPPYGVDADHFGSNFTLSHEYHDSWEYFLGISRTLSVEAFRILKEGSHAYVFCSFEGFSTLASDFRRAGFRVWPQPLIWSKGNGNAPWVHEGHKRTYECILFAAKGSREVNVVKADVLTYPAVADREHAAEKPVELYADLLGRSVLPGQSVIDPFCGSGPIFPAADKVSCVATGIEREIEHYNLALTKLEK